MSGSWRRQPRHQGRRRGESRIRREPPWRCRFPAEKEARRRCQHLDHPQHQAPIPALAPRFPPSAPLGQTKETACAHLSFVCVVESGATGAARAGDGQWIALFSPQPGGRRFPDMVSRLWENSIGSFARDLPSAHVRTTLCPALNLISFIYAPSLLSSNDHHRPPVATTSQSPSCSSCPVPSSPCLSSSSTPTLPTLPPHSSLITVRPAYLPRCSRVLMTYPFSPDVS